MSEATWLANVRFRTAQEVDLKAMEWDGEFIHYRRLYRQLFEITPKGNILIWIADLSGVGLVGQLFVQLNSDRMQLGLLTGRAYIYGFRVKPDYRNAGLGGKMLLFIENDLVMRGYLWSSLNVGKENLDALRFYQRHGYNIVSSEEGIWSYIDHLGNRQDVHEPAWRMEKKIT